MAVESAFTVVFVAEQSAKAASSCQVQLNRFRRREVRRVVWVRAAEDGSPFPEEAVSLLETHDSLAGSALRMGQSPRCHTYYPASRRARSEAEINIVIVIRECNVEPA